jgi:hypothetical protein
MNFLLFCAFGCGLRLLVIQLTITAYFVPPIGAVTTYNTVGLLPMPVITRSQAKLSIGSTFELSAGLPTGSHELSDNSSQFSVSGNVTLPSSPVLSSQLLHCHLKCHPWSRLVLCLHGDDLVVSNGTFFQNSNFEISEISKSSFNYTNHRHNFGSFSTPPMAADCQYSSSSPMASPEQIDINQLFTALSTQITNQTNILQDHIRQNDLSTNTIGPTPSPVFSVSLPIPASSSPLSSSTIPTSSPGLSPTNDVQTQMMMMLTESFSKLSTDLSYKNNDTKSDWPKFSGDSKKFRAWYLAILAQLSLPPWQELYDPTLNDIVAVTSNTNLNGKLYAKLLVSLEGLALQSILSRTHLRANGLLLLQELTQTYKQKNVPEIIAAKTSEFWGNTKCLSSEMVDTYYYRFHELLDDLCDADEPISTKSAMRHFIYTLGPEFETIQNNFCIGNLPSNWFTQEWPALLVLCHDYYNSVKPQGVSKRDLSSETGFDRIAQHKKIRDWFMNPSRFRCDIEAEQKKHPGKCIYHLSNSHTTDECYIKKECDKIVADRKSDASSPSPNASSSGHLHHIKDDIFEDAVSNDFVENIVDESTNDTNNEELIYFARVTNHYLRLVMASPTFVTSRHNMKYPIIADSGANYHMFKENEFFETLHPANGRVYLGDGKTALNIQGIGTVKCKIGNDVLTIDNV